MGNIRSQYGVLGAWSTTLHDPQDPIGMCKYFQVDFSHQRLIPCLGRSILDAVPASYRRLTSTVLTSDHPTPLMTVMSFGTTATNKTSRKKVVHSMCYSGFFLGHIGYLSVRRNMSRCNIDIDRIRCRLGIDHDHGYESFLRSGTRANDDQCTAL